MLGLIHPPPGRQCSLNALPDDILRLIAVLEQEDPPLASNTTLY
jgi:hypothetical protein